MTEASRSTSAKCGVAVDRGYFIALQPALPPDGGSSAPGPGCGEPLDGRARAAGSIPELANGDEEISLRR